jgi:hypothetical protein
MGLSYGLHFGTHFLMYVSRLLNLIDIELAWYKDQLVKISLLNPASIEVDLTALLDQGRLTKPAEWVC